VAAVEAGAARSLLDVTVTAGKRSTERSDAQQVRQAAVPELAATSFAANSLAVASWTAVSRASGFVRVAVVGAVLGPTYLGNIFQATSSLPMLCYAALTGSLFSSLLVPRLVRHIDAGDREAARRLAGAFLSTALVAFAVAAALILLAAPGVLRLLSLGVEDAAAAAYQQRIGLVLIALFIPQLLLYAVVGTAEAVVNAHGKFALPNAAPIVENVGIIATMVVTVTLYGSGTALTSPPAGALLLLGLGTTTAVALHAALQWWGAWRVGVPLLPRRGWRDPETRRILRGAAPSLGYSCMDVLLPFGAIVVANRVAGGVVAFQLAYLCGTLPVVLAARPVSVSLLPRLSRLFHAGDLHGFRDELVRGAALVCFLVVPAAVALVLLAQPIARAITFGQMASPHGQAMVAVCLASLGPAVLGFAVMMVSTYASYARGDARTPFRAAALSTSLVLVGVIIGLSVPAGGWALFCVGSCISVAILTAGGWLGARLRRSLPSGGESLFRPILRTAGLSVLMAVPAYAVARALPKLLPSSWGSQASMLTAILVAVGTYLALQRLCRSPELELLGQSVRHLRRRSAL
jgi:putative peptidoglycan lipid II flippase